MLYFTTEKYTIFMCHLSHYSTRYIACLHYVCTCLFRVVVTGDVLQHVALLLPIKGVIAGGKSFLSVLLQDDYPSFNAAASRSDTIHL